MQRIVFRKFWVFATAWILLAASASYGAVTVTGLEITHNGNIEFNFNPSATSVGVLEGVVGEEVSFEIYVTSNANETRSFYHRWTNPDNPALNAQDLGNETIAFTAIDATVLEETSSFNGGKFIPPFAGIFNFEILDGSGTLLGKYSLEVVDLEKAELTYAQMRTPTDGESVNITHTVTLSARIGPQPMRSLITVDYYVNGYRINDTPITYDDGGEFFNYEWEVPYIGTLEIEARAQLASGSYLMTTPISINTVGYGSTPVVILSAPPGDSWVVGSDAQFSAQASDSGALVQQIDLYVNGHLVETIGEAWSVSPWTFDYKFPSSGPYDIWVIAQFSNGNKAISNILEYELELGSEPFVYMISPSAGMQFLPGSSLPILASTWDPNSLIEELKYFVNDTLIETSVRQPDGTYTPDPITFSYNFPFAGNYRIYVQATDESGVIAQSEVVQVIVRDLDSRIPTVVMSHPLPVGGGDTVNDVSVGSAMYINAIAEDGDGTISKVNFYINSQLIGSSSNGYNDTYSTYFKPTTAGNYVMFAEAIDNSGNRMHSPPLLLNVYALEAQLPKVKVLPLPDQYKEFDSGTEITVSVEVDGGLVDVSQVNYYVDGVLVDSQDTADEDDEDVFTASFIVDEPGVHLLSARAIEIDPVGLTTDNWSIADPVGVRAVASTGNRSFVNDVYLSIMGTPVSQTALDSAVYALNNGQMTQAQYIYNLMEGATFDPTLQGLMARYLLTGEWPSRNVMISDTASARASLPGFVNLFLPTFQSKYWDNKRIPDGFSTNEDFKNFFKVLFQNKYNQDPTSAQTDRGVMQMKVFFMEDFVAELVRDTEATSFGSGTISTILGIPNPPNSLLEDRAYVASLFCNLLKVTPNIDDVEGMLGLTKVQQIQAILDDPRF